MADPEALKSEMLRSWEEAKQYLRMGGDITYAYLRLALKSLELAEPLIKDEYCRGQVKSEISLLRHALNLAMVAFEWKLGATGLTGRFRLWLKAVKESALILLLQIKRALA